MSALSRLPIAAVDYLSLAMGSAGSLVTAGSVMFVQWSKRRGDRMRRLQTEATAQHASFEVLNDRLNLEIGRLGRQVESLRAIVEDCERKHEDSERRVDQLSRDLRQAHDKIRTLEAAG